MPGAYQAVPPPPVAFVAFSIDWLKLMELALHWVGAVAAHVAAHTLVGSGGHCECVCSGSADAAVLALLKGQLDRCGPARLCAATNCLACEAGLGWRAVLVGVVAGVILGVGLAAIYGRWSSLEPSEAQRPFREAATYGIKRLGPCEAQRPFGGPATLRALRGGSPPGPAGLARRNLRITVGGGESGSDGGVH